MLVCGILWRTLEDFSYPGIKIALNPNEGSGAA